MTVRLVQPLELHPDAPPACPTPLFGPEPTQIGTTAADLAAPGVDDPKEGPMIDVLLPAAPGQQL